MDELIELYKEGLTHAEIGEELGLAPSTVGQYIYKEKINKDENIMEIRSRALIRKQIDEYENRFGIIFN